MSDQLALFAGTAPALHEMHRTTDPDTSKVAASTAKPAVRSNYLLILRLLVRHDWLTQFCPAVLTGEPVRYKQTAVGPRYKWLLGNRLIERIENRQPRKGAETKASVMAYRITPAGREWLASQTGGETQ